VRTERMKPKNALPPEYENYLRLLAEAPTRDIPGVGSAKVLYLRLNPIRPANERSR
jgi:hypothetical protein